MFDIFERRTIDQRSGHRERKLNRHTSPRAGNQITVDHHSLATQILRLHLIVYTTVAGHFTSDADTVDGQYRRGPADGRNDLARIIITAHQTSHSL